LCGGGGGDVDGDGCLGDARFPTVDVDDANRADGAANGLAFAGCFCFGCMRRLDAVRVVTVEVLLEIGCFCCCCCCVAFVACADGLRCDWAKGGDGSGAGMRREVRNGAGGGARTAMATGAPDGGAVAEASC